MVFAPVLQDVAARMSGSDPGLRTTEPERWAYALGEAVSLVRPDWVVTHYDLALEADAVADRAASVDEVADLTLVAASPVVAALTLTKTLADLYPSGVIAASVTGPALMATRLVGGDVGSSDSEDDPLELLDLCGDHLAELASAHVERGAQRVIVWEATAGSFEAEDVASAHSPLIRRLETLDVPVVLCAGEGMPLERYAVHASPMSGRGARLVSPERLAAACDKAGQDEVVLTDGPIPESFDMAALARLGGRAAATA